MLRGTSARTPALLRSQSPEPVESS
jgi:hypothetical protein